MKILKFSFLMMAIAVLWSSCETYGDPEVKYSVIFPLSGEWIGDLTSSDGLTDRVIIDTYNTSDENASQMWLRIYKHNGTTGTTSGVTYPIRGKVDINLNDRTFSVTDELNNLTTSNKFSVQNGSVTLKSVTTPSGAIADKISFTYTSDRTPGVTYTVSAYRRTAWPEDE